jgi:hypothetical protein
MQSLYSLCLRAWLRCYCACPNDAEDSLSEVSKDEDSDDDSAVVAPTANVSHVLSKNGQI